MPIQRLKGGPRKNFVQETPAGGDHQLSHELAGFGRFGKPAPAHLLLGSDGSKKAQKRPPNRNSPNELHPFQITALTAANISVKQRQQHEITKSRH